MQSSPLHQGVFGAGLIGAGPVTRDRVHARAHELAVIAGRAPPHVTQADYEQAKREVTGESDLERQEAILDSLPGKRPWDPVPGSTGRQAPEGITERKDIEGRGGPAPLVDQGVADAARDQILQTAVAAGSKEGRQP